MELPRHYRGGSVVGGTGATDVAAGADVTVGAWVKVCGLSGPTPSGSSTVVVGPNRGGPSGPVVVASSPGDVVVVGVGVVVVVLVVVVNSESRGLTFVRGTHV